MEAWSLCAQRMGRDLARRPGEPA